MRIDRLTSISHPVYNRAMELYRLSFPFHEQRETPSQKAILKDDAYHFGLIQDDEQFVGLVLYWELEHCFYIEHFCVLSELRGHRYGQRLLDLLAEQGKPLVLEIDPPVDRISQRRKGFYERCGFVENPYPHVHPAYHRGNQGHALVVMSRPAPLSAPEYETFRCYLEDHVMKDVF